MTAEEILEGKIILCGADHLISGNLDNFFKEEFDIGILWNGGEVNNTVVLVNTEFGNKEKIYILGAGSNTLISDKTFDGAVIKLGKNFPDKKVR